MTSSRSQAAGRGIRLALAAGIGVVLAMPATAQWKWRDKAGHTQYSDLPPPPGVPEGDILQRPSAATRRAAPIAAAPAASTASAAPLVVARPSDPELEARRKKADQEAADKKKADDAKNAAIRADNCGRAREEMRTIDSGQRMTRTNEKGEREFLDDAARASEARRAREAISSECK